MKTTVQTTAREEVDLDFAQMAKKKCTACGKELPLSSFRAHPISSDGHYHICESCLRRSYEQRQKRGSKINPLEKFTARQLMDELYRRGYRGRDNLYRST